MSATASKRFGATRHERASLGELRGPSRSSTTLRLLSFVGFKDETLLLNSEMRGASRAASECHDRGAFRDIVLS